MFAAVTYRSLRCVHSVLSLNHSPIAPPTILLTFLNPDLESFLMSCLEQPSSHAAEPIASTTRNLVYDAEVWKEPNSMSARKGKSRATVK